MFSYLLGSSGLGYKDFKILNIVCQNAHKLSVQGFRKQGRGLRSTPEAPKPSPFLLNPHLRPQAAHCPWSGQSTRPSDASARLGVGVSCRYSRIQSSHRRLQFSHCRASEPTPTQDCEPQNAIDPNMSNKPATAIHDVRKRM